LWIEVSGLLTYYRIIVNYNLSGNVYDIAVLSCEMMRPLFVAGAEMTNDAEREAVAWRAEQTATEIAKHAHAVKLDTLAYLLQMVALEAKQHVALKGRPPKDSRQGESDER
jgi:hypothetical protein